LAQLTKVPGLRARIRLTHWGLAALALARAFWPLGLLLALFVLLALSGGLDRMTPEAGALISLFSIGAMVTLALLGWRRLRWPGRDDAIGALESGTEFRPVTALSDRQANPGAGGSGLWQAHQAQLARAAARLRTPGFAPDWARLDPARLRYIVPLSVIGAVILAGDQAPGRLQRALSPDIGALVGADDMRIEAWISPPDYSGRPPIFLEAGMEDLRVPAGSKLTLRAFGRAAPTLVRETREDTRRARFETTPDGAHEAKATIETDTRVAVRWWGEQAAWQVNASPDAPPKARFTAMPELLKNDRMGFEWAIEDDYGVERLELAVRLREPHPAAPDAEDRLSIDMKAVRPGTAEEASTLDTTRHRWAGLPVLVELVATDAAGQEGRSEAVPFVLPDKLLLQPLAKAAQEARVTVLRDPRSYQTDEEGGPNLDAVRAGTLNTAPLNRLEDAPPGVRRAALMLDSLTLGAPDYIEDRSVYLGLEMAHSILASAPDKAEADNVDHLLWAVALKAEYGSAADALRALLAARKALEQALRDGASEDEIRRLMEAFRQAAQDYLAAKMAEAVANGLPEGENRTDMAGQQGSSLGGQDFEDMLNALEDLTETGASGQARQLLSDITNMLENLQFQQGNGGGSGFPGMPGGGQADETEDDVPEAERELSETMQRLSDLLREQRELNDERLAEQRGEGGSGGLPPPDAGNPGQPGQQPGGGLAQRQRELSGRTGRVGEGEETGAEDGGAGQGEKDGSDGGGLDETARERLETARRNQERAARALERGDYGRAGRYQDEATEALRDLSAELAEQLDAMEQARGAQGDEQGRDPFGRPVGGGNDGRNVRVPDKADRQRARDILDELRRRYENSEDPAERDYLERLLDRF